MAIDESNSDGSVKKVVFIDMEKNIDSIKPKYHKYINEKFIREFSKNQFSISIEKKEISSLKNFMEERKRKIKNTSNVKGTIKKKSENHFINKLYMFKTNKNLKIAYQYHIMQYYYKKGLLYTFVFTTTTDKKSEYRDVSKLIFNSFKFLENDCNK